MLKRELTNELLEASKTYPIVTLIGPRQSGKTTLVQEAFPQKKYINLEDLELRALAQEDPKGFLSQYPQGAILDEIQRTPDLLSYLQVIVDQNKQQGQFILTGSHQLDLHQKIAQSLAGRTAILKLLPLSLKELADNKLHFDQNELLLRGGYPKLYSSSLDAYKYYANYCQTYLERDVRQLINVKDLSAFQHFMKLCASRVACPLNASEISSELGVSVPTVKHWLSVLEASFLIFRLPPYFINFGKRLNKTPKLYFTDLGLASYLLGIENVAQISRDPARGRLIENLVVIELLKARLNQGRDSNLYFYRDKTQLEIDVILQRGHQLVPIEIKSSTTFHSSFIENLEKFYALLGDKSLPGYLVYSGMQSQQVRNTKLINYLKSGEINNS